MSKYNEVQYIDHLLGGKSVLNEEVIPEVIDESWLDDELTFYTELVKKNPKSTELKQKLMDIQRRKGILKEEDIVVNEDADRELMGELEKFKKKLKEKIPVHHWAHVKVWSSFNAFYNTIYKIKGV